MRHATTRRVTVLATMLSVLLVAGVAFAAWLSNGEGDGTAQATTAVDSAITEGDFVGDLYPGAEEGVTVNIDNPNEYPVIVTGISGGSSDAVGACEAASVSSDARSSSAGLVQSDGTTVEIPAGGSGEFELVTHMIDDPDNSCQGAEFNLPLTATLASSAG